MRPANLPAIGLMTAAMAAFAVADLFIKFAARSMSAAEIILWMGAAGTLAFAGLTRSLGHRVLDRAFLHPVILARNGAEVVGASAMVAALAAAPLSLVTAIGQTTPLLVTLGAALALGERVGVFRWSAVFVGLCGVLLMLRPGVGEVPPGALLALLAVIALATRDLLSRRLPRGISTFQLGTWGFAVIVPAGCLLVLLEGGPSHPEPLAIGYILAATAGAAAAYWFVTTAMRMGEASVVAPFRYTRLIFALGLAVAVLGERPDAATLAGAAIVLCAGLVVLMRERRRGPAAARP